MRAFVTPLCLVLLAGSASASEDREVSFGINLADQLSALHAVRPGATFDFTMFDIGDTSKRDTLRIGSGTLKFADTQFEVPQCVARLIQSSKPQDVSVELINSSHPQRLTASDLQMTFAPSQDVLPAKRQTIRLQFALDPLSLIGVQTKHRERDNKAFEPVPITSICQAVEISIMHAQPRK
jgi:hypothetical protein